MYCVCVCVCVCVCTVCVGYELLSTVCLITDLHSLLVFYIDCLPSAATTIFLFRSALASGFCQMRLGNAWRYFSPQEVYS